METVLLPQIMLVQARQGSLHTGQCSQNCDHSPLIPQCNSSTQPDSHASQADKGKNRAARSNRNNVCYCQLWIPIRLSTPHSCKVCSLCHSGRVEVRQFRSYLSKLLPRTIKALMPKQLQRERDAERFNHPARTEGYLRG